MKTIVGRTDNKTQVMKNHGETKKGGKKKQETPGQVAISQNNNKKREHNRGVISSMTVCDLFLSEFTLCFAGFADALTRITT